MEDQWTTDKDLLYPSAAEADRVSLRQCRMMDGTAGLVLALHSADGEVMAWTGVIPSAMIDLVNRCARGETDEG